MEGSKVKLTWSPVSSVTKYRIFCADKSDGQYQELTTVAGTQYIDENAPLEKDKYYKISVVYTDCLGEEVEGLQSSAVHAGIPLQKITLNEDNVEVDEGGSFKLLVSYVPENTTEKKTIKWSSSDAEIAEVKEDGTVTGISAGEATITATAMNGKTTNCKVVVKGAETEQDIPLQKITMNKSMSTITEGTKVQLSVKYTPENTTEKKTIKWSSSNPKAAEVKEDGTVTGISAGQATITATAVNGKTASCKVTVREKALPFTDVKESDWYYDTVKYANKTGIMTGLSSNIFGPTQNIARAQFAVILHRMNGKPRMSYQGVFPDVANGIWYTDAILWASNLGVVTGYSDSGYFGPADNITREQIAVMMYRYAKIKGYNTTKRTDIWKYSDGGNVSGFAQEAMKWCVAEGIISGKDYGTRLDPQGHASRAECAAIMQRFLEKYKNADSALERKYSSAEIMEMYKHLMYYNEGKWKNFGGDKYQNMVKTAIDATVPFYWYFGDVDSIDMRVSVLVDNDDALMNGENAKNQFLSIQLGGLSSANGDTLLECLIYSPDGVHLVCNYESVPYVW